MLYTYSMFSAVLDVSGTYTGRWYSDQVGKILKYLLMVWVYYAIEWSEKTAIGVSPYYRSD